jgi:hypothetical protein
MSQTRGLTLEKENFSKLTSTSNTSYQIIKGDLLGRRIKAHLGLTWTVSLGISHRAPLSVILDNLLDIHFNAGLQGNDENPGPLLSFHNRHLSKQINTLTWSFTSFRQSLVALSVKNNSRGPMIIEINIIKEESIMN